LLDKKYPMLHIKKAKHFLDAAWNDFDDGFYDTSISHAYYAMHHAARALLLLLGESPKTHSGVINVLWSEAKKFSNINGDDVKKLSSAFGRRIECDYGVEFEMSRKEDALDIIHNAEDFVDRAESAIEDFKLSVRTRRE